jgi:hypothetical protein
MSGFDFPAAGESACNEALTPDGAARDARNRSARGTAMDGHAG